MKIGEAKDVWSTQKSVSIYSYKHLSVLEKVSETNTKQNNLEKQKIRQLLHKRRKHALAFGALKPKYEKLKKAKVELSAV